MSRAGAPGVAPTAVAALAFRAMESLLIALPVLLLSVIVHEVAHAWVASTQGDPTARMLGRITLNPVSHIDPVGSLLFPLILLATNAGFIFGWARPVPVDPRNFRNYRRGDILVSLAGIAANLLLAAVFTAAVVALIQVGRVLPAAESTLGILVEMARWGVRINLILAVFNLLPIPPLDGSHVVYHLLPRPVGYRYRELSRYGLLILLAIFLFAPGVLTVVWWPVAQLEQASEAFIRLWL